MPHAGFSQSLQRAPTPVKFVNARAAQKTIVGIVLVESRFNRMFWHERTESPSNFGFSILRLGSGRVLAFRLGAKEMTKKSRPAFFWFRSDNRKSTMFRLSSPRVQNPKWVAIFAIAFTFAFGGAVAEAQQQGKVPRIGLLTTASTVVVAPWIDAFRQGLRELGYVEGKNIILEIRGGEANPDRQSDLAAELVRLKVDIIVATGGDVVPAVKEATRTIPIVMRYDGDPVSRGVISSLAHPGGNITGLASLTRELIGKRLELLAEVVPEAKRVAVLAAQTDQARYMASRPYKELEAAARALGMKLQVVLARDPDTIDKAFLVMTKERVQALIVIPSGAYIQHREHIIKHAAKHRLPAIYSQRIFVENGGLMSYAADYIDEFRRLAIYVDKILKGRKPADLPVEQPTKFELVINLKTAQQIGLTIPQWVLMRADKVIR
jgi:putative tryptophan/tyrosine transport system substrate-binding protein